MSLIDCLDMICYYGVPLLQDIECMGVEWNLSHFSTEWNRQVWPDLITITGILSACSHAGLLNECWLHFKCRIPLVDHYAGMVGLLGHAGQLDDACAFIIGMSVLPDAAAFGVVVTAYRIHWNLELEGVTVQLFYLEPQKVGYIAGKLICCGCW